MQSEKNKNKIYMGIIIIALGVVMTVSLPETTGLVGFAFIAIGVVFFVLGIRDNKKETSNDPE